MFDDQIGVSTVNTYAVDYLHTVCLGVMGSILLAVIWKLVSLPAFGGNLPEKNERQSTAAERLRSEMGQWFSAQRLLGHQPPFLDAFTLSMFGSADKPTVKTKGHESKWIFKWCVEDALP
eukprot:9343909-Pyramimonas_sp.AAC.1